MEHIKTTLDKSFLKQGHQSMHVQRNCSHPRMFYEFEREHSSVFLAYVDLRFGRFKILKSSVWSVAILLRGKFSRTVTTSERFLNLKKNITVSAWARAT